MADEFNPQGVDQTPQNNENPNNTADTGNIEPKSPFVGGASVDAGNASDSSEPRQVLPIAEQSESGNRGSKSGTSVLSLRPRMARIPFSAVRRFSAMYFSSFMTSEVR